eukprot:TRINITY_DN8806_c0_g1_i5.p1 TRINITY_DN8806_c0_g1~~TRINITY_DN8806_c0_g1_i5.p1  ORF type:complete len:109 (-),score=5.17 TRINITY_DN8806_c0_g1_i5:145-471(-)
MNGSLLQVATLTGRQQIDLKSLHRCVVFFRCARVVPSLLSSSVLASLLFSSLLFSSLFSLFFFLLFCFFFSSFLLFFFLCTTVRRKKSTSLRFREILSLRCSVVVDAF